ncbi:HAD family hydrolase [candidate division KSB1 bacterium]|nr:HAD family hydrolase [candidate division KSB1 bacterium]
MRYKQIIWDWNGTLIDDTWLCLDIINGILATYQKPQLTLKQYHEVFDFPVRDYYAKIGFDFTETPFEIVGTEFMQSYWRRWPECVLHRGARELCEILYAKNIPQVIISAAERRLLEACVRHFDIDSFFQQLWGLDHHYATGKEDLIQEFVDSINLKPEEILLIGDTVHDCAVARTAGIESALICRGHHPRYKLERCGAPVYESIEILQQTLDINVELP